MPNGDPTNFLNDVAATYAAQDALVAQQASPNRLRGGLSLGIRRMGAIGVVSAIAAAAYVSSESSVSVPEADGSLAVAEVVLDVMPENALPAALQAADCAPDGTPYYFANDAPEGSKRFDAERVATSASEAYAHLVDTLDEDPAKFVAETEFLGLIATKTPEQRDAKVLQYIDDPAQWAEDCEKVVAYMDSAKKSLVSFTGDYYTYYMEINPATGRPVVKQSRERMVNKQMLRMEFTQPDGTVITKMFKVECGDQPVQPDEFVAIPKLKQVPKQPTTSTTEEEKEETTTSSSTSSSSTSSSTTAPSTTSSSTSTTQPTTTSSSTSTSSTSTTQPTTTSSSTSTTQPTTTSSSTSTSSSTTAPSTTLGPTTTRPKPPLPPVTGTGPVTGPGTPNTLGPPETTVTTRRATTTITAPAQPGTSVTSPDTTRPPQTAPTVVVTTRPGGPPPSNLERLIANVDSAESKGGWKNLPNAMVVAFGATVLGLAYNRRPRTTNPGKRG